jgi:hypothetical protein
MLRFMVAPGRTQQSVPTVTAPERVTPRPGSGDLVTLLLLNPGAPVIPAAGQDMCTAALSIEERFRGGSPSNVPWPYAAPPVPTAGDIDAEEAA